MPRVGEAFYELTARDQKLLSSLQQAEGRIRSSGRVAETSFGGTVSRAFDTTGASAMRATRPIGTVGGLIQDISLGRGIRPSLTGQDGFFRGAMTAATNATTRFGGAIKGIGGVASAFGIPPILGYAAAVGGVIAILKRGVSAASDMNETVSKVGVVFGQAGPEILRWGETAATSLGLSKQAALAAAGTFGNLFVALKLPSEQIPVMSKGLIQLAADLASFNNVDPAEALDALRSGLVGETEPLRRFGVNLNEATIAQKALELGLISSIKQGVTPAIKAQATYALIMEQTATAQGDFARTSDGLANQQRIAAAKIEDAFARMGEKLLPLATQLLPKLADAFIAVIDSIGPLIGLLGDAVKLVGDLGLATPIAVVGTAALAAKVLGLADATKVLGFGLGPLLPLLAYLGFEADKARKALDGTTTAFEASRDAIEHPFKIGPIDIGELLGIKPAVAAIPKAVTDAALAAQRAGEKIPLGISTALEGGVGAVADAAGDLAKPISEKQKAAQVEAARIAALTPFEIAKSIREGADPVKMAAALLADAIKNGIAPAKEIANIQGALAGDALQKALNSKIPDIRAAGQAYKAALEERLFALQHHVPQIAINTGVDYGAALAGQRAAVGTAAHTMLATARAKIVGLKADAAGFGDSTGDAYGDALAAALRAKLSLVLSQLRAYRTAMAAGSPPKPGAVLYGIEKWGYATGEAYADPFARALGEGVATARDKLGGLAALLSGSPAAGRLSMTPAAGLLSGAAPGVRMGLDPGVASGANRVDVGGIVVQMQIDRLDAADPVAIRDLGRALGAEIRLSLTRSPTSFALPNA